MKKQEIKGLKLNKKSISNLETEEIKGGLYYTHPRVTACSAGCSIGMVTCPALTC